MHGTGAPAGVPVVLALGANLGEDPDATLRSAVRALGATDGVTVDRMSPVVTTAPVGGPEQPDYRNAVVLATTSLDPETLL
jgi:2-amino-4-hydroxy-6-hydroxymethyldihydropteridine diphosphokinase